MKSVDVVRAISMPEISEIPFSVSSSIFLIFSLCEENEVSQGLTQSQPKSVRRFPQTPIGFRPGLQSQLKL